MPRTRQQVEFPGIYAKRDSLPSIAYSEELISATISATLQTRTDTMGLWAKSVVIIKAIREHGKQSIRSLAERTGLSKSRGIHLARDTMRPQLLAARA